MAFQLYLWHPNLDPNIEPKIKVIKTCIYGLRSSGNLAERALRITAEKTAPEYPLAYDILMRDLLVDDCISGGDSLDEVLSEDVSFSIHHRNIQKVAIEMFKVYHGISNEIMNFVFPLKK